nr:immunoglobulin heavy chain junction region [Mus musculus]
CARNGYYDYDQWYFDVW